MRQLLSPLRLALIGASLFFGASVWVLFQLRISPSLPGFSNCPSTPGSIQLAGLGGVALLLYAAVWTLVRRLKSRRQSRS